MKSYPFAILFSLTAVVVGLVLQISLGSISKNWFSFPYNVVVGAIFVLLTTLSYFLFRKTNFILRCSSVPFAIVTVVTLGVLTIGLGSINVKPHQLSGFLGKMGLDDLTKTWYFGLVFVLTLTNLWFSILKRSMVYQRKNIPFLLNHFGLWLTMFAGVLGQGDIIRLKMNLYKDKLEWRATTDDNRVVQLPIAMELKEFSIDIYPNKGKRSGAYSWGGYTTKPFILLNFDGTLNDVYTLIHELGHSMHSYYTRKNQPYVYGSYSIFVAEVASTCNEALLTEYLYNKFEKEGNKNGMLRVLNQALSGFVGTVYRQTQFAEFEHKINQQLQNGGAITAEYLNTEYFNVVKKYYGDVFTYDEDIKYEWSRVPHFYYNYYVYQYATGYSAAQALSKLILEDSKNAKVYIDEFLSKGNSDYPIEVLKNAGVDMSKPDAIELALQDFKEKIEKFEKLYF